ncbi:MAG: YhbY family RNA-binding protein [Gemmatimonadaceae bacterium]
MKGSERAELRAEAHHLKPTLHVGHAGLTEAVVHSLDDVLRTHELVKCQVAKGGTLKAKAAAESIAPRVAAEIVQVIGRTFTLYRHNPDLHTKAGALPPWRR